MTLMPPRGPAPTWFGHRKVCQHGHVHEMCTCCSVDVPAVAIRCPDEEQA